MLFKMFSIEQSSAAQKRRQVFITQSRVLVQRVQEYYVRLAQSLATGRKNQEETINIPQDTLAEKKLMELDEDNHSQSRLPKKFCELTDDHFPLFVTFDKVHSELNPSLQRSNCPLCSSVIYWKPTSICRSIVKHPPTSNGEYFDDSSLGAPKMYQWTSKATQLKTDRTIKSSWGLKKSSKLSTTNSALLTGPIFPSILPKVLVRLGVKVAHFMFLSSRQLDPALVWSEFLGVICGSEASLDTSNGYVDYETYQTLSHRTQSTFTSRRGAVYELFQVYVKRKRELRTYDVANRCEKTVFGYLLC